MEETYTGFESGPDIHGLRGLGFGGLGHLALGQFIDFQGSFLAQFLHLLQLLQLGIIGFLALFDVENKASE